MPWGNHPTRYKNQQVAEDLLGDGHFSEPRSRLARETAQSWRRMDCLE